MPILLPVLFCHMMGSDADSSDSETEFDSSKYSSKHLTNMIKKCKEFVPDKYSSSVNMHRAKLNGLKTTDSSQNDPNFDSLTRSLRSSQSRDQKKVWEDQKKVIEESFKSLSGEMATISKKFNIVSDVILSVLDDMETFNTRLSTLETFVYESSKKPTYSEALTQSSQNSNVDRIEKLEYQASEDERRKKLLEATVTHPSIDNASTSLLEDTKFFFSDKLKIENREIDQNCYVRKSKRANTVVVTFSDRRFKLFMYRARKKLRSEDNGGTNELFLNDNLTTYNFSILMNLKREKKKCRNKMEKYSNRYTL